VSPADKLLKIPARETRSRRKILLSPNTFAVIPLIIELIRFHQHSDISAIDVTQQGSWNNITFIKQCLLYTIT